MKIHIVQKGDTLWKIAKKYGVNFDELKKLNAHLSNPDMIMPGMKIKIPTTGGTIKKESQVSTKKEQPIMKEQPIIKEQPKLKEQPVAPPPKIEEIKEVPKKPFIPKMPQPIIPDIDIHNYYMMNMANLNVKKQEKPKEIKQELPKETPQMEQPLPPPLPPHAADIFPEEKPYYPEEEEMEVHEEQPQVQIPEQGGVQQKMYPCPPLFPISPVLPGPGPIPGACYPTHGTYQPVPYPTPLPGVAPMGQEYDEYDDDFDYSTQDGTGMYGEMADPYGSPMVQGAYQAQGFAPNMYPMMPNSGPTGFVPHAGYYGAGAGYEGKDCGCGGPQMSGYHQPPYGGMHQGYGMGQGGYPSYGHQMYGHHPSMHPQHMHHGHGQMMPFHPQMPQGYYGQQMDSNFPGPWSQGTPPYSQGGYGQMPGAYQPYSMQGFDPNWQQSGQMGRMEDEDED